MPIAAHPDYLPDHWKDVLSVLTEAISETDFEPRLVSDDVAIGLIHDRIVTNIYHDDIVVCDVSSRNPNVMFELGLRLAFDKPTIIIKDEKTAYSFDTGVIEHLSYPSSLRFSQVVEFKKDLAKRINATYQRSVSEPNYSPFLKSFGKTIVPATLQQTEIPEGKYIREQLDLLRHELRSLRQSPSNEPSPLDKHYFHISDAMKKQLLYALLDRVREDHPGLNEKDAHQLLKEEAHRNGINVTNSELLAFMEELRPTER